MIIISTPDLAADHTAAVLDIPLVAGSQSTPDIDFVALDCVEAAGKTAAAHSHLAVDRTGHAAQTVGRIVGRRSLQIASARADREKAVVGSFVARSWIVAVRIGSEERLDDSEECRSHAARVAAVRVAAVPVLGRWAVVDIDCMCLAGPHHIHADLVLADRTATAAGCNHDLADLHTIREQGSVLGAAVVHHTIREQGSVLGAAVVLHTSREQGSVLGAAVVLHTIQKQGSVLSAAVVLRTGLEPD